MKTTTPRFSGSNIRTVLVAQGRRQDWLASQVGISATLLNLAISEKRSLSLDVAQRIAEVLQVPFVLLFEFPIGSEMAPLGQLAEAAVA